MKDLPYKCAVTVMWLANGSMAHFLWGRRTSRKSDKLKGPYTHGGKRRYSAVADLFHDAAQKAGQPPQKKRKQGLSSLAPTPTDFSQRDSLDRPAGVWVLHWKRPDSKTLRLCGHFLPPTGAQEPWPDYDDAEPGRLRDPPRHGQPLYQNGIRCTPVL